MECLCRVGHACAEQSNRTSVNVHDATKAFKYLDINAARLSKYIENELSKRQEAVGRTGHSPSLEASVFI